MHSIQEILTDLLLAVSGFAATNLENVVVLVAVFCAECRNSTAVRLGFGLGALVLLALSLTTLALTEVVPVSYLGWLGIIPIAFGVREIFRRAEDESSEDAGGGKARGTLLKVTAAAAMLMIVNGGDTIAVFAPLFAETLPFGVVIMVIGYSLTALVLAVVTGRACTHPGLAVPLQRFGPRIAPYIMIAIGIYVLLNTSTDRLPG